MFKKIEVENAVGMILAHDVNEVDLEKNFKGVGFKKGHKISSNDIEKFKRLGKNYVYVFTEEVDENIVHEDEAAITLAPLISGDNISFDDAPSEGKINFYSTIDGLLKIDVEKVVEINLLEIPSLPTKHDNFPVKKGEVVAAFRIIPLFCEKEIVEKVKSILDSPAFYVKPYILKRAGIIVTGSEIFEGRKKDSFIPKLTKKLKSFDVEVVESKILPDDKNEIERYIKEFIKKVDILFITGGTSVDPDDQTKRAIEDSGVLIVQKGNPIQPGNNFTIGYLNDKPVCAVPAAALYYKATALDIFLPRLLAGEKISKEEIAKYSVGGLCHFCKVCVFPVCPFGK